MNYPRNVKDIKNLNEFIRKAKELETDKYWSNILYDCSSANYADWTRRKSRLAWKREMIQKYLNYKNNILEESDSRIQGLEGYLLPEIIQIAKDYIREALLYANEDPDDIKITDIQIYGSRRRGTAKDDSDLDVVFEYEGDFREDDLFNLLNDDEDPLMIDDIRVDFNPICVEKSGDMQSFMSRAKEYDDEILSKKEEKASIDWNNYLTPEEVKRFLSKDDKMESAENIIYSKEFQPRYRDLHNSLQAKYKNSWTKKELVQDLNDFYNFGHLITEDYVLRGLQNGKSYDLAYNKSRDKLEKFRDEVIGNKVTTTWIDEHKIEESKHKIEEKSRNELLAKTKSQTITRYNKAQGYKGFYIYDIDTSTLFNKDSTMLIVCKVGDYHSQVEIENVLYWIEYYAEQNENLQINTKNVTQALMDAIDGWNIKVNCECRGFYLPYGISSNEVWL